MATEVVMPQMGESIAEGTITKWLVKVGDRVERDQPLFEISTDKVDAEIPSPAAGTLLEIRHQEGETVPVQQVVAILGEAGESAPAAASPKDAAAPGSLEERVRKFSSPLVRSIAKAEGVDLAQLQ
ncbi:MAG TPA: biotin/lipoyl-containing protein, partial [Thermoanaerobaculia bacterium]|nr:biotin/lipoyl-containing protein [Thermoanaerobaculia bacterium]